MAVFPNAAPEKSALATAHDYILTDNRRRANRTITTYYYYICTSMCVCTNKTDGNTIFSPYE